MIAGSRGLGEAVLVVVTAAALAAVLTYPLARHIDSIGRVNTDDGRWSIWVVSWVAHALTTNPLGVFDANIFYPHARTLAFSEANIGAGAIGAPIWALTRNPHLTHNLVVFIGFIVSFAGAYYLTRYFTGSRAAAAVAGTLYAFCPFIFARTAHIQLLLTGGIPFCMLAFHRLVDRPTVARAVTLGLLIWIQALACAYYGVFVILMIGLGSIFFAFTRKTWRSLDYVIGIALAAFVSIALTLPFFIPYVRVQQTMGFARTLDDAREYSANAGAWFASSAWAHRWWLDSLGSYSDVLFPGLLALGLGVAGALWQLHQRARAPLQKARPDVAALYALIGVIAFWSSFGPDAGLYWVLYETIPFFTFMRAPGRFGILVVLALVVLAAPLLAAIFSRARRPMLAAAAVVLVAAAELAAVPLNQYRRAEPVSSVYQVLSTLPYAPVAEFPYWYRRVDFPRHAQYMLNSTAHWRPLINGYSDHIPQDFRDSVLPISTFPSREAFAILAERGARYVVFHMNMYNQRAKLRLQEQLAAYEKYLRPLAADDNVQLYEIVGWPE